MDHQTNANGNNTGAAAGAYAAQPAQQTAGAYAAQPAQQQAPAGTVTAAGQQAYAAQPAEQTAGAYTAQQTAQQAPAAGYQIPAGQQNAAASYPAPMAADPYDPGLEMYYEEQAQTADKYGKTGLALSIAGFCTGFMGIGMLLDLVGITFGALSINKNKAKKSLGISAITIGSVGFLLTLLIYGFAWSSYTNQREAAETQPQTAITEDSGYQYDDIIDSTGTEVAEDETDSALTRHAGAAQKYSIGDTITVKTRYGDYSVKITGVHETEERNQYADSDPKRVVVVDYEYENISYTMDLDTYYSNELYLSWSDFNVYDADGRALDYYPASTKSPHAVTPGHKTSGQMAFALDDDTNYLEMEINDYAYDGPGISVDLNW